MPLADWRDCLRLWIGATEQPFHDFAIAWLFVEHEKGRYQIRTDDVRAFFDKVAATRGPKAKPFSDYAKLRGARDLLRMATELGMLSGLGPVKTFASIAMSDDVDDVLCPHDRRFRGQFLKDAGKQALASGLHGASRRASGAASASPVPAAELRGRRQHRAGRLAVQERPRMRRKGSGMSDFERRLRDDLEPILGSPDPREKLSAYHDMPYALFRYDPEQEYPLRRELTMLRTRLLQKGKAGDPDFAGRVPL